ncbi:MAG: hypothetical protein SNH01_08355 [Rikenellaceae bacterium]
MNIFDKDKFAKAVERVAGTAAKADTIASRTAKYITENIEKAPDFYKKFSDMLKETILAYEQGRISDLEYLNKVNSIKESVLNLRIVKFHSKSLITVQQRHSLGQLYKRR